VNDGMKVYAQFYYDFLIRRMLPSEIIREHPDWKGWWDDASDGQYGRPAAFYQQLHDLNLGRAWQEVNVPVLLIAGTGDDVMSRADSLAIFESVNRVHPGRAEYLEIAMMTHGLTVSKKFHEDLIPTVLKWMNRGGKK
jgi:hypothetical protein